MKKLVLLIAALVLTLALSGCSDLCVGTDCITGGETPGTEDPADCTEDPDGSGGEPSNAIPYDHINGHGIVVEDFNGYLLFEYEMRDYVKYQVTYLSCTCRNPDINYWQVMYIEINKSSNTVRNISFGAVFDVSTGHDYTPGMWGDSSPTPNGKYLEDFETDFIPWLLDKSLTDLDGISVFTNDDYHGIQNTANIAETDLIDSFAGSSVSTNNMIRITKSMLEYHEENY